jgi:hypothetical protein
LFLVLDCTLFWVPRQTMMSILFTEMLIASEQFTV